MHAIYVMRTAFQYWSMYSYGYTVAVMFINIQVVI